MRWPLTVTYCRHRGQPIGKDYWKRGYDGAKRQRGSNVICAFPSSLPIMATRSPLSGNSP